jgi:WD40 repeat protein
MPSGIQHTPNLSRVHLPYKGLVGGVRLWDPATGAVLQTLGGHRDLTYAIAFSHDGKLLASASWDMTVRLWDPATGTALQTLEVAVTVGRISFSRDAQYLETDTGSLCLVSSSNICRGRLDNSRCRKSPLAPL